MRQFTHVGDRHLLGQWEHGYGIWLVGQEHTAPVLGFPLTVSGWSDAVLDFQRLEPLARPLDAASAQLVTVQTTNPVVQAPPPYGMQPGYGFVGFVPAAQQSNGMATTGGTVGILGAVLSLIPLLGIVIGLLMGLLAIIFSGVGLSRAGSTGRGRGLAVTGLVLGILTVVFKLIPGVNLL